MRAQTPLVRKPTGNMINEMNNNSGDNDSPDDNEEDFEEEPAGLGSFPIKVTDANTRNAQINRNEAPNLDKMQV